MKISKKSFIFMGISSLTLVAYPAYVYSSSINQNTKPKPKPQYNNNIFKEFMNKRSVEETFPFLTDPAQISSGIKVSEITPSADPTSIYGKMYNQITNTFYSSLKFKVTMRLKGATGSEKTRLTNILSSVNYYQSTKYFKFLFSSENNITPGFSTTIDLKLLAGDILEIDAGSFTVNTNMTDEQKGIATTYWFSKQTFTGVSLLIDAKDLKIADYSAKLKQAIQSSPEYSNINEVYKSIFESKDLIIQPNDKTATFIPNDLTANFKILFKYKDLPYTPFKITAAATNSDFNAYMGTWSSQAKKEAFLAIDDKDTITPAMFANEPGLTSITIAHGKLSGRAMLGGAPNVTVLKLSCKELTTIPSTMFYNSTKLTTLDLRGLTNLESIETNAFRTCPITLLYGLNNLSKLTSIGTQVFQYGKFTNFDLSNNPLLESIGDNAFPKTKSPTITPLKVNLSGDTKLKDVYDGFVYDNGSITDMDLSGCASLTSLDAFTGGAGWHYEALNNLDLSGMTSLKSIPAGMFKEANITEIKMAGDIALETIGDKAFPQNSYTSIDFAGDAKLQNLYNGFVYRSSQIVKFDLSGCASMTSLLPFSWETTPKDYYFDDVSDFNISGMSSLTSIPKWFADRGSNIRKIDLSGLTSLKASGINSTGPPFRDVPNSSAVTVIAWKGLIDTPAKKTALFTDKWSNIKFVNWTAGKVVKPIVAGGSVAGLNGKGVYTPPTLAGTTVTANKTTGLSNGDDVTLTYNLNPGYVWEDESVTPISLTYKVEGLNTGVIKPTEAGGSVTGLNGAGVYTPPTLTGTTVSADKTTGLSNNDEIKVTYTLTTGHVWTDKNTDPITLTYTVKDLNALEL